MRGAGPRTNHLERLVAAIGRYSPRAAISLPGSDSCRSKSQPQTARSSARSPGPATVTCASCSYQRLGGIDFVTARYGVEPWVEAAKKRVHPQRLAIALPNKLARIAWGQLRLRPNLRERATVLGAGHKTSPANAKARTRATVPANLDNPCVRCPRQKGRPERRNGLTARTKKLHRSGESDDRIPFPLPGVREDEGDRRVRSCRRRRTLVIKNGPLLLTPFRPDDQEAVASERIVRAARIAARGPVEAAGCDNGAETA